MKHATLMKLAGTGATIVLLSACQMNSAANPMDGLEFRQARYEQMMRLEKYETCREDGLELDRSARARGAAGGFLTSAKVLQSCAAELSADDAPMDPAEPMRLEALAITNYLRGGDVPAARSAFDDFKTRYPEHDLYFADGSSFRSTTEALLGRAEKRSFGEFAALNVNDTLKHEMRRLHRWQNR
ncbi:MAG: hypothetical protein ACPGNT_08300 [Rhodospirillales bacterium]